MKWGLRLRVNPLFLLLIFLFTLTGMLVEAIIAFSLVLFHELIHLIVAFHYGYNVNKIELFPFGGMAEYNGLLEMEPLQELKVALAGPLFNLLAGGLFYFLKSKGILLPPEMIADGIIIKHLIEYNLVIAIVNFIPALPLDGGRVLRALLVRKMGFERGSKTAIKIARTLAVIIGISGFIVLLFNHSNIWFLVLAFFVYAAASREERQLIYYLLSYLTRREQLLKEIRLRELSGQVVRDELTIKEVLYTLNPVKYNLFFVIDRSFSLRGILTEGQLLGSFFAQKDKELRLRDIL
ncbi:MAG TPA: M50 family metallopeptidase, partial [Halanaerobiales bacterium]|nr:M50 family metallopeptidase [Halanaerobiales bacterium]